MKTTITFKMAQGGYEEDANAVEVQRVFKYEPTVGVLAEMFHDFLWRMTYEVDAVDVISGEYTHSSDNRQEPDEDGEEQQPDYPARVVTPPRGTYYGTD